MEVLLDAHALVWWPSDPTKLSQRASGVIASSINAVMVSALTALGAESKVKLAGVS